ncbi:hypothetical protein F5B21DRAFT_248384 [Xylaria acuta]|nr:hypothetical protein F5B21DRAFT_248384 [Xylaria acuta]
MPSRGAAFPFCLAREIWSATRKYWRGETAVTCTCQPQEETRKQSQSELGGIPRQICQGGRNTGPDWRLNGLGTTTQCRDEDVMLPILPIAVPIHLSVLQMAVQQSRSTERGCGSAALVRRVKHSYVGPRAESGVVVVVVVSSLSYHSHSHSHSHSRVHSHSQAQFSARVIKAGPSEGRTCVRDCVETTSLDL